MAVGIALAIWLELALEFESASGIYSEGYFFHQICLEDIRKD
jgi:hypothetical protein